MHHTLLSKTGDNRIRPSVRQLVLDFKNKQTGLFQILPILGVRNRLFLKTSFQHKKGLEGHCSTEQRIFMYVIPKQAYRRQL
jgi:hypothetical protein